MKKLFIMFLVSLGLSNCITTQEKSAVSEIVTDTFSPKKSRDKETKLGLTQNKIKNDVNKYKFTQWKCYKSHWLNKYKQLILTVGYFPEFQKFEQNNRIGMLELNDTKSKKLAIYSPKGVQHFWNWGGKNFNNYQIIIHPSGNGWFYDFQNTKPNEQKKPRETYDCKPLQTISIAINDIGNVINELNEVPNFEVKDLIKNLQIHMLKCFKLNFPTTKVLKNYPTVTLQIFINKDGVVKKTNFLNRKKYETDMEYKIIADIASKAVMSCSHLPIPKSKTGLSKNFIMDFNSNFILEN